MIFVISLAIWVTFVVFLGIYAFDNPDKDVWLGYLASNDPANPRMELYATEAALKSANAINPVHMH